MTVSFTEHPCPEDAFSIRLVDRSGIPVLLAASMIEHVPHARAYEPGAAPLRLGPAPMSVYADWDARPRDGGWETVVSLAGSAMCNLCFQDGLGEISTREEEGRPLYQSPRFVRETGPRWRATAVSNDSPDVLVLLERDGSGRLAVRTIMDAPNNGDFREAVLVRSGASLLLAYRSYFQGSVRPDATGAIPYRTLWVYETVRLGTVVVVPLAESLSPAGPPVRPFGDALAYQMDAAPLNDGRAAIFATTPEGYRIAIGDWVGEGSLPGVELTSPTMVVCGGSVHMAAIASRGGARSIVRAELRV